MMYWTHADGHWVKQLIIPLPSRCPLNPRCEAKRHKGPVLALFPTRVHRAVRASPQAVPTQGSEQDLALVAVPSIGGRAGEDADVLGAEPADHQGPVRLLPVPAEQSHRVPQPVPGSGGDSCQQR